MALANDAVSAPPLAAPARWASGFTQAASPGTASAVTEPRSRRGLIASTSFCSMPSGVESRV